MLGANPPSSPTLLASYPYLDLITFFKAWYISDPIYKAWEKLLAPVGNNINSYIANLLPACLPPLITLREGTGVTNLLVFFPAN